MKYWILQEESPGSGLFKMTTDTVDSDTTHVALELVDQQFADGIRRAVMPYSAQAQTQASAATTTTTAAEPASTSVAEPAAAPSTPAATTEPEHAAAS